MISDLVWLIPGYGRFHDWMWPEKAAERARVGKQLREALADPSVKKITIEPDRVVITRGE